MARKTKNKDYRHLGEESVQRPEIGLEAHVMKRDHTKKPNQTYNSEPSLANESSKEVDSSMSPEFTWNEDPDRDFAEFLIELAFKEASGKTAGGGGKHLPRQVEMVEDKSGRDHESF